MVDTGICIGDTVEDTIAAWKQTFVRISAWYTCRISHDAMCPKETVIKELKMFMEKVLPELGILNYEKVQAKE